MSKSYRNNTLAQKLSIGSVEIVAKGRVIKRFCLQFQLFFFQLSLFFAQNP